MNKCLQAGNKKKSTDCPYYSYTKGSYSFCNYEGFDIEQTAKFLNKSTEWLRKNAGIGWKAKGRWYFPRCYIFLFLYDRILILSSLLNNELIFQDELLDCWKLKEKFLVERNSNYAKRKLNIKAEQLLKNCSIDEKEYILEHQVERINKIKDRLFTRVDKVNFEEFENLISKNKEYTCKNKDEDYLGLVGISLYKASQKRVGIKNPFEKIVDSFNSNYRSGVGWQKIRKDIIKKRGSCCEECGSVDELEVHHKINPQINNEEALVVLCKSCHDKKHKHLNRVKK